VSAGSPRVTLRIPAPLLDRIKEAIERNNQRVKDEPWVYNTWIIDAIRDKLAHQDRGRLQHASRARRKRPVLGLPG
jgi:hypothetical protein